MGTRRSFWTAMVCPPASIRRMSAMVAELLAVAVQRGEEGGRFERGVAGVAELLGDPGERRVGRVGVLRRVLGHSRRDAGLDVQAALERLLSLVPVELDAV